MKILQFSIPRLHARQALQREKLIEKGVPAENIKVWNGPDGQDYAKTYQIFEAMLDDGFLHAQDFLRANFAYHETCCRTAMEAMLSGCGLITGKHPLWDEYPVLTNGVEPMEVADILKSAPPVDIEKTRDWALSNVSYKAFSEKIRELL